MRYLITGAAGFIGFHTAQALLNRGDQVLGIDNLNDYYSVQLKRDRLAQLDHSGFEFHQADIADLKALKAAVGARPPTRVIHLAAQAGVRYSLTHPEAYVRSNRAMSAYGWLGASYLCLVQLGLRRQSKVTFL